MCIELPVLYLAMIIWIGDEYRAARGVFGCVYLDWRCVSSCLCCIWLRLFGLALCVDLLALYFAVIVWIGAMYRAARVVPGRDCLDWRCVLNCLC